MTNEKPGGHGERSVAVGTLDMAIWDATAKIAGKPLFRMLAEQEGRDADPRVFVYAAGGYYYPGKDLAALRGEMRGYLDTEIEMSLAPDKQGLKWKWADGVLTATIDSLHIHSALVVDLA